MVSVAPVVELGLGAPSAFDTYADSLDVLLANPSWFEQLQPAASGHVQTASPSLAETPWEATPSAPHFCREALAKDVASVGRLGSVSGTLPSTEIGRFGGGPAAQAPSDSLQRKASVSREAQRRFRQRKKERAKATEAQLLSTTAQLAELKAQQQLLQAKNHLLEQQQKVNKHSKDLGVLQHEYDTCMTAAGPGIITSMHGNKETLSTEEASTMQLPHFVSLWTEYIQELGSLLVQLGDGDSPNFQLEQRLQQVTIESSQLMGIIKSLNVEVYKAVLKNGVGPPLADGQEHLGNQWYLSLERMIGMSEEQISDLLYLRKLYLTKRGLLAAERGAMTLQMRNSDSWRHSPGDNLDRLSDLSSRLKENAAADYAAYLKIACSVRRGVFTTKQWAAMIVYAYPFFPCLEQWLDTFSSQHSAPSSKDVLMSAREHPLEAEWAALDDYIVHITQTYRPDYVPVQRSFAPPPSHRVPRAALPPVSLHDMLL